MENLDIPEYDNSQTWEAWIDSALVLWENTDALSMFLILILPVGIFLSTHFQYINFNPSYFFGKSGTAVDHDIHNDIGTENVINSYRPLETALHTIESKMTDVEKDEEKRIQSDQLAKIYSLMMEDKDKFLGTSLEDVQNQMKFYSG